MGGRLTVSWVPRSSVSSATLYKEYYSERQKLKKREQRALESAEAHNQLGTIEIAGIGEYEPNENFDCSSEYGGSNFTLSMHGIVLYGPKNPS